MHAQIKKKKKQKQKFSLIRLPAYLINSFFYFFSIHVQDLEGKLTLVILWSESL